MKYKFDEEKLLGLFLNAENCFSQYAEPFLKDGYVYATDTDKLIRIKAEALNGRYKSDKINYSLSLPNDNCNSLITQVDIEKALASVPQQKETVTADCSECEGAGVVFSEYIDKKGETHEIEAECPICGGIGNEEKETGKIKPFPYAAIAFGDSKLHACDVQVLLEAMRIIGVSIVHLVSQTDNRIVFRIDENISIMIVVFMSDNIDAVIPIKEENRHKLIEKESSNIV